MSAVLAASGLTAGYGRVEVVRGVGLELAEGRILAVLGPNGSGKSTLIKALAGLLPAWRGRVLRDGADVTALSAPARARAGLAYVPQEGNVFRSLTVEENLRLAVEFLDGPAAASDPGRREAIERLFPDLAPRRGALAGQLSGGQRQMLAFASALMTRPKALLLDEPSAGLSPRYVGEILEAVRAVNATGVSIVMVEQNVKAALEVAHDALVMVAGEVRVQAPAAELRERDDLPGLFLGKAA